MKKKIKIFIAAISAIFCLVVMLFAFWLKQYWWFKEEISADLCLKQRLGKHIYDIARCQTGEVLVDDVNGWIIDDQIVYGSHREDNFFAIQIKDETVKEFRSMREINEYLSKTGLASYDMNKEENVSHLKYGGGRDRVYKRER